MNTGINNEKVSRLVEELSKCSLDDLQTLISALSAKYGVDFSKLSSSSSSNDTQKQVVTEDKKSLYLVKITGDKKTTVMKLLTSILGLKITEVNDKVKALDNSPILIKAETTKADVQDIWHSLEDAGAVLELR